MSNDLEDIVFAVLSSLPFEFQEGDGTCNSTVISLSLSLSLCGTVSKKGGLNFVNATSTSTHPSVFEMFEEQWIDVL